jgi:hypothetical protein
MNVRELHTTKKTKRNAIKFRSLKFVTDPSTVSEPSEC